MRWSPVCCARRCWHSASSSFRPTRTYGRRQHDWCSLPLLGRHHLGDPPRPPDGSLDGTPVALRGNRPLEILAIPARLEEAHIDKEAFLERVADQLGVDALPESLAKAGLRSPREAYSRLAVPYLPLPFSPPTFFRMCPPRRKRLRQAPPYRWPLHHR